MKLKPRLEKVLVFRDKDINYVIIILIHLAMENLPEDLLRIVLSFLLPSEIAYLSSTSKYWKKRLQFQFVRVQFIDIKRCSVYILQVPRKMIVNSLAEFFSWKANTYITEFVVPNPPRLYPADPTFLLFEGFEGKTIFLKSWTIKYNPLLC